MSLKELFEMRYPDTEEDTDLELWLDIEPPKCQSIMDHNCTVEVTHAAKTVCGRGGLRCAGWVAAYEAIKNRAVCQHCQSPISVDWTVVPI